MVAPQTQHEIDGGVTDNATETLFLETLATETDALHEVAGLSDGGRPIHRLDLGNPDGSTWVIQTLAHGNEPAAREAVLAFIRDLAYSTDPTVQDYLTDHRVIVVTPVNPDGLANGTRNTPQGDINRDHLSFNTASAKIVQNLLHAVDPDFVVDAHERFTSSTNDMEYFGIGTLAVHEDLRALSHDAGAAVHQSVTSAGHVAAEYSHPGRVSGREIAAFHHAVSLLLESWAEQDFSHRVAVFRLALDALMGWHQQNATTLGAAKRSSKAAAQANYPVPYILQTGNESRAGNWPQTVLPENLIGYRVTGDMPTELMTAFGVVEENGVIHMGQTARVVIPLLFDPASADKVTTAGQIIGEAPREARPILEWKISINGSPRPITEWKIQLNGVTRTIAQTRAAAS